MKYSFLLKPLLCTVLIFIFMALLHVDEAVACHCVVPPLGGVALDYAWSPPEHAEMIFEGTVETLQAKEGSLYMQYMGGGSESEWGVYTVVTVRVSAVYRGPNQQSVTVITGIGAGDCGVPFKVGEEYLIFAEKGPADNLFTEICLGTDLLEREGPRRRILRGKLNTPDDQGKSGKGSSPVSPRSGGKICGKVMLPGGETGPRVSATVTVWETKRVFLTPTLGRCGFAAGEEEVAANGSYCVPLDRGTYWVGAEADFESEPSEAYFEGFFLSASNIDQAKPVEVKDGKVTKGIDFKLREVTLATVRVLIRGQDRTPVKLEDLQAGLFNQDGNFVAQSELDVGIVNSDGKAAFAGVAPGNYRLVLLTKSGPVEGGIREIAVDGKDVDVEVVLPPKK